MENTDYIYIGFVEFVGTNNKFATLVPLFKYLEKEDIKRVGNPVIPFPERGYVFWAPIPAGVHSHAVFRFKVRESPSFNPSSGKHDRYAVDGVPERLMPIVEGFEDESDAREWLTSGIELRFSLTGKCFVRIGADKLLGPVELQRGSDGKYRYISGTTNGQISVTELREDDVLEVRSDSSEYGILSPFGGPRREIGQVDWDSDEAVLRRAIRILHKLDETSRVELSLSDRAVKRLAEVTSGATLSPLDQYRVQRALQIVGKAGASSDLCTALEQECLLLPQVIGAIEKVKFEAKAEALKEAQLEAEMSLEQSRAEVERLHVERDTLLGQKHEIAAVISDLTEQRKVVVEELDASTQTRLNQILSRPSIALTDLVVLRPILELIVGKRSSLEPAQRERNSARSGLIEQKAAYQKHKVLNFTDRLSQLESSFPQETRMTISAILSALFSASTPCVVGLGCDGVLRTIATSFFASTSVAIAFHPGLVSVEDLLGSPLDSSGKTLRDFLSEVRNIPLLHLLVLEGVNRSYGNNAVISVLKAVESSQRPNWPASQLSDWPSNVLVAATLDGEGLGFPLPTNFWQCAAFSLADTQVCDQRDFEAALSSEDPTLPLNAHARSTVPLWRSWLKMSAPDCEISLPVQRRADDVCSFAQYITKDEFSALAMTIQSCLFPALMGISEQKRSAVFELPEHQHRLSSSFARFQEVSGALLSRSQNA